MNDANENNTTPPDGAPAPTTPPKVRKPRVARPKVEKATGKVTVLAQVEDALRPTEKQPDAKLRTKKALEKWIKTNCGAGTYAAVRTIVKVQITEEVITSKKSVVL